MKDFKEWKDLWEWWESEKKETYSDGGVRCCAQLPFGAVQIHFEVSDGEDVAHIQRYVVQVSPDRQRHNNLVAFDSDVSDSDVGIVLNLHYLDGCELQ